ncbi:MAG: hypothetical protein JW818_16445 [Pirellulales bacterium]|nr:hypothetical protein [Pirellulales bacterium]
MKVHTYEGVVENGRVQLPAGVLLPEKAKVFVIVPRTEVETAATIRSPRLADPGQAMKFEMENVEE